MRYTRVVAILLFFGVLVFSTLQGQVSYEIPKVIPPSPAVQNFMRYGEIPVDYSTGVPNISVPLYTVKSRKLEVPVSISYHASGIKVNDKASVVGLGWVLNAAGFVNVTIMGLPDGGTPLTYQTATAAINARDAVNNNFQQLRAFGGTIELESYSKDWQSDRYSFQLPGGQSGVFQYDFVTGQLIKVPYSPVAIEKIMSGQVITGFKITDEAGTIYSFEMSNEGYYSTINKTTWEIQSMISADKTDTIRFFYKSGEYSRNAYISYAYTSVLDCGTTPHTDGVSVVYDPDFQFSTSATPNHTTERILDSIVSATTTIKFTAAADRQDMALPYYGGYRMAKLSVYDRYSRNLVKEIDFNYSYFGTQQDNNLRLRLDNVSFKGSGGTAAENYTFGYQALVLPPYPANSNGPFSEDYWGYYNTSQSSSLLPGDFLPATVQGPHQSTNVPSYCFGSRNPDSFYAKACMITHIGYPTGGRTTFEFEANTTGGSNYNYPNSGGVSYVGGFRIRKISNYSDANTLASYKTFEYSNGVTRLIDATLFAYPQRYFYDLGSVQSCVPNYYESYRSVFVSNTFLPLTADNGPPIFYETVTEYNGDANGNTGKTVYTYEEPPALPSVIDETRFYSAMDLNRGNYTPRLLTKEDFKNEGGQYIRVSKKENVYTSYLPTEYNAGIRLVQTTSYPQTGSYYYDYSAAYVGNCNMGFNTLGHPNYYYFFSNTAIQEVRVPTQTKDYAYSPDGTQSLVKTTDYTYGNLVNYSYGNKALVNPTEESTVNSKGETFKQTYKFSTDFPGSPVCTTMVARNILAPVIEQSGFKGTDFLQSAKTNYDYWNGSAWSGTATDQVNPRTVETKVLGNNPETRLRYHNYDAKGNMLSVSKENDARKSYIWGYRSFYPVAEVNNAATDRIAYTSFEEDDYGGWSLNGGGTFTTNDIITGKRIYAGGVNKTVPAGNYVVTAWATGSITVNSQAGTLMTTSKRNSNWKLYEWKLNNVTSVQVTADNMDEVRLYPAGAQMTTYTYTPLVGITSQCDVNNGIRYYVYDNFGRLSLVYDEAKNILKKTDYQYKQSVP